MTVTNTTAYTFTNAAIDAIFVEPTFWTHYLPTITWSWDGGRWRSFGHPFLVTEPGNTRPPYWDSTDLVIGTLPAQSTHVLHVSVSFTPNAPHGTYAMEITLKDDSGCGDLGGSALTLPNGTAGSPAGQSAVAAPTTATRPTPPVTPPPSPSSSPTAAPSPTPTPAAEPPAGPVSGLPPVAVVGVGLGIGVVLAGAGVRMGLIWWSAGRRLG
jgi:hypothetical protein